MNRSMTAAACAAVGLMAAFPAAAACALKTQPIPITMTGASANGNGVPTALVKVNGKTGWRPSRVLTEFAAVAHELRRC